MLVLGSILAPSMLHTAYPAFPVVLTPSESRRMTSAWHSHNCVFRQLLLTFLNSDIICDESQECWGHFALLVASIWSVDAKLWTLSRNFPTFIPATSFPFPICLVRVFCLVRVKTSSGFHFQIFISYLFPKFCWRSMQYFILETCTFLSRKKKLKILITATQQQNATFQ